MTVYRVCTRADLPRSAHRPPPMPGTVLRACERCGGPCHYDADQPRPAEAIYGPELVLCEVCYTLTAVIDLGSLLRVIDHYNRWAVSQTN